MEIFQQLTEFLDDVAVSGKKPLVVVLGATASGKTALSLRIAKMFHGEIISADSRQIYKYMDIGTDKLLPAQQNGIPHHLIDELEPNQEFTVADFKRAAIKSIEEILRRRHLPILAGGTGLYLNTVLQNYQIPRVPPQHDLRFQLQKFYEQYGAAELFKLLQEKDPEAAARIHPNNVRYVIRALEINIAGNTPKVDEKAEPLYEVFSIGIEWPREILYERIEMRVDELINKGLLNEVKTLLMKGYDEKIPAMTSIGYQELIEYIRGKCSMEEAVTEIKKNTRNYAKRQLTWFRHYQNVHWVRGEELETYLSPQSSQRVGTQEKLAN
ncbi:MAG: tRNA (adenosine(37)-N6)-dimethylallyltransferase MiaA [Candidatus Gracilibacteria bacterium]